MANLSFDKTLKKVKASFLENLRKAIEDKVLDNIDNELDSNGQPFHPLTGFTKKKRKERNTWPGKILNETGKLRKSIKAVKRGDSVSVKSNVSYAQELNDGRSDMQPRKFLDTPSSLDPGTEDSQKLLDKAKEELREGMFEEVEDFIHSNL